MSAMSSAVISSESCTMPRSMVMAMWAMLAAPSAFSWSSPGTNRRFPGAPWRTRGMSLAEIGDPDVLPGV